MDLHKQLINQFGGSHGIRDKRLLESALAYPQLLYGIGMERDKYILAASFGYHLINNYPFVDGNKRIGILAMLTFLRMNEIVTSMSKKKLFDLAIKTAKSEIDVSDIAKILKYSDMA